MIEGRAFSPRATPAASIGPGSAGPGSDGPAEDVDAGAGSGPVVQPDRPVRAAAPPRPSPLRRARRPTALGGVVAGDDGTATSMTAAVRFAYRPRDARRRRDAMPGAVR